MTSLRRKPGTVTSSPSAASATPKPSAVSVCVWRARGMTRPSSDATLCSRRRIVASGHGSLPNGPASIVPPATVAPVSSIINLVATAWASIACSGARPFSKRPDASLRNPRMLDVRWMLGPIQEATSISTRVVSSPTSERAPPMTPAIDVGPSASSMTSISASSVRVWPSSVSICSPSVARRTVSSPPATLSRSKACSGWPVSSIT